MRVHICECIRRILRNRLKAQRPGPHSSSSQKGRKPMGEGGLVIRGGTVVDGTGAEPREADVAVEDGRIVAVGRVTGRADDEIDAKGLLVTPGFVDIHTHYDGQATWSSRIAPSSSHGVTTAIMGNCGVGFA